MPADRIEREIDIDARSTFVWTVITEPEHITGWFTDSASSTFAWTARAASADVTATTADGRQLAGRTAEPPHFFLFRWEYPDGDDPPRQYAPLVEFSLEAEAIDAPSPGRKRWRRLLAPMQRRRPTSPSYAR